MIRLRDETPTGNPLFGSAPFVDAVGRSPPAGSDAPVASHRSADGRGRPAGLPRKAPFRGQRVVDQVDDRVSVAHQHCRQVPVRDGNR